MTRPCGLLLLDKPGGPTSHDAVAAIRRASGERRVGHAGTLDPIATGLLPVCLGPATRICEYLSGHDKRYHVEAWLGVETTTYDRTGEVVATYNGVLPTDGEVGAAVASLVGEILQRPPAYSAIKIRGKPLYLHARQGTPVLAPLRRVSVYSFEWKRLEAARLSFAVHCSTGTYVRSLVHDVGRLLGCGAHVAELRRLAVGPFKVEEAWPLDEASARLAAGDWSLLIDMRKALSTMPVVSFDELASARLRCGQTIAGPDAQTRDQHLALDEQGCALGIVVPTPDGRLWRPRKVFAQTEEKSQSAFLRGRTCPVRRLCSE